MLADRVRMGSSGGNDLILYDKGKIYAEYGRTKNFSVTGREATITFNSDHFHIYAYNSGAGSTTVRAMVGFKLPPDLPTNAKILVKYFDCDSFSVSLAPSINYLNSKENISIAKVKNLRGYHSGTGEVTLELGDTTGHEIIGVASQTFSKEEHNIRIERLEVII